MRSAKTHNLMFHKVNNDYNMRSAKTRNLLFHKLNNDLGRLGENNFRSAWSAYHTGFTVRHR